MLNVKSLVWWTKYLLVYLVIKKESCEWTKTCGLSDKEHIDREETRLYTTSDSN